MLYALTFLALLVVAFGLERWSQVRREDARARMRCADIRAERHRAPLEETIAARVERALGLALVEHRGELDALEQDIRDARSRMEMGKRPGRP
jgi:hypothetical protein